MHPKRGLLLFTQVVDERDENLGFFVSWLRRFAESGTLIHVICWRADVAVRLPSNVSVTVLPTGKIRRTLAIWRLSWKWRAEISSVFVHMIAPVVVVSGWLWRLLGLRVVLWYTHGDIPWTLRVAEVFAHRILTATDESCRLVTSKKVVTGHGIDVERFRSSGLARRPLLLTVGRISPRKDQLLFVELCRKIHEHAPELQFHALIVGDPRLPSDVQYADQVRARIRSAGLETFVEFMGSKVGDELIALYSEAALFVSTSKTGSLDKVVLEALACETPVLAVGSAFRGFAGSTVLSDICSDEAVELALAALRDPRPHVEARQAVIERAEISLLIKRVEHELYV